MESARRPGRPRDPRADTAILEAASRLFVEEGPEMMSMERVARAAGVSKTTIYRRWSSKEELVADAVGAFTPSGGSVARDAARPQDEELGERLRRTLRWWFDELRSPTGRALPRIVGEVAQGSAIGTVFARRSIEPLRTEVLAALRDAAGRGEVASGLDVEVAADLVIGPLVWAAITRRIDVMQPADVDALAELTLSGLRRR